MIGKKYSVDGDDINDIKEIIDYFAYHMSTAFMYYEDAIKYMFLIAQEVSIVDLEEEYKRKYLNVVSKGLKNAGESDEIGYAFRGKDMIMRYASCLTYNTIVSILRHNDRQQEGILQNDIRPKVINWIILYSSLEEDEKGQLKFRFIDSYIIGNKILSKYTGLIEASFKEFHYVQRDDTMDKIFISKLQNDNNENLYIKIDFFGSNMSIALSRNDERDDMDYIWDTLVILSDDKIGIIHITDEKEVRKSKNFDDCEYYFDFSLDNVDTHQYDKYDNELNKLFDSQKLRNEQFELIYVYGEGIYDLEPIAIYFKDEFCVDISENEINVCENKDKTKMPDNFFGENIHGIHAIIGKNGMGKSSIFKLISECNIFGIKDKNEIGQYFIIYRLGNYYYYTNSTSKKVSTNIILPYKALININICMISNVFELFCQESVTGLPKHIVDLTTQSVIAKERIRENEARKSDEKSENVQISYLEIEKRRIENLNLCFKNDFEKFQLKDYKDIHELSLGEKARLILFARLLSIFYIDDSLKKQIPEIERAENYILMIDEAELYMHPSWQRRLIADIIEFIDLINKRYRTFSNITILFSSNSPFLMSDLPKSNIHLLGADMEIKTFGQNIYSILRENFFMNEGVVGSFAQEKIDKAFGLAAQNTDDKRQVDDDDNAYINYILNILGDPLLKSFR